MQAVPNANRLIWNLTVRCFTSADVSGKLRSMFVIELIYKAELTEIDARMKAHVNFLRKYYAAGNFLVSGRKIPRDGGVILAVGESRAQIEAIIKEDPFCKFGLADFRVIEFRASQRADDIQQRIDRL
ncbi:MAG TPA: YciI family protein [Tepidisphaeraceae bacterium]|nr:YciI family protein [Tepidisphaeraceae bacterium]